MPERSDQRADYYQIAARLEPPTAVLWNKIYRLRSDNN